MLSTRESRTLADHIHREVEGARQLCESGAWGHDAERRVRGRLRDIRLSVERLQPHNLRAGVELDALVAAGELEILLRRWFRINGPKRAALARGEPLPVFCVHCSGLDAHRSTCPAYRNFCIGVYQPCQNVKPDIPPRTQWRILAHYPSA